MKDDKKYETGELVDLTGNDDSLEEKKLLSTPQEKTPTPTTPIVKQEKDVSKEEGLGGRDVDDVARWCGGCGGKRQKRRFS